MRLEKATRLTKVAISRLQPRAQKFWRIACNLLTFPVLPTPPFTCTLPKNAQHIQEAVYCFWTGTQRQAQFLGWTPLTHHPPPPPPSVAPTQTKRVPICSFIKQASICILIKTWNWSVAELWGKNWDTDAHAHMTYQAPITGLHSPTLLPFLQNSTEYLMLAQSCKFGVDCCFNGLTYPAACTRARVPLTFAHVHRPPLTQFAQKGINRLGLSWVFRWYI